MEDLREFLQNTATSINEILSRYIHSSSPTSELLVQNVKISLPMDVTHSIHSDGQLNLIDVDYGGDAPKRSLVVADNSEHCTDVWNCNSQMQSVPNVQEMSSEGIDSFVSSYKGQFLGTDALGGLLEEIKTAIHDWSFRQRALFEGSSLRSIHEKPQGSSDLYVPNGALFSPSEREHSCATGMKSSGDTNSKENSVRNQKEERTMSAVLQHCKSNMDDKVHPSNKPLHDPCKIDQLVCSSVMKGNTQADSLGCRASNAKSTLTCKENKPAAEDFSLPMDKEQETTSSLTKWIPPAVTAQKPDGKLLSLPARVEIIPSPDWLPEGWITELKTRSGGTKAGSKDKYYVDPVSKRRFRSRNEVTTYLGKGKASSSDNPEKNPVEKFSSSNASPSVPCESARRMKDKKASIPASSLPAAKDKVVNSACSTLPVSKRKGTGTPFSSAIYTPLSSSTVPGTSGNLFVAPFRMGGPSEWLAYESIASLPFPMFDPFFYRNLDVNKSSSDKTMYMPARPWFFSGPPTSWSPFVGARNIGNPGDKGNDYQPFFPVPPLSSGSASQSFFGSTKKRKSSDQ
ncbi:hypothetical protein KP509_09G068700 [Ceratopteris richardii]|nr:hypothetical protein KP509_09G068700 [Ceratopteris richardii]